MNSQQDHEDWDRKYTGASNEYEEGREEYYLNMSEEEEKALWEWYEELYTEA